MSCGKEKKWNGDGMESRMENCHKFYVEWNWNRMESRKENVYLCFVEWKNNAMESGMEMEWNNLKQSVFSGME